MESATRYTTADTVLENSSTVHVRPWQLSLFPAF